VAAAPNPSRNFVLNRNDGSGQSFAGFGQVDYAVTDQFKLHLGARYTWDQKKAFESVRLICFLANFCAASGAVAQAFDVTNLAGVGPTGLPPTGLAPDRAVIGPVFTDPATGQKHRLLKADWQAWTGTAGLDWTPDAQTLAYAKYTRGYKAGGFNAGSLTAFPTTKAEFINAYELGLKKTLLGGALQANASAFYYDYRDIQVPLTSSVNGVNIAALYNVPKARSTGFELETVWQPIERLQILANYAYLNAKLTDACCFVDPQDPTAVAPGATPAIGAAQDLDGQKLPSAPPHRVTVNTNYTWLLNGGRLNGSVTWLWRDDTYYSIFNRAYNLAKAYDQVDLRATWTGESDRYTLIGYVKNAFDRTGYDGASATLQSGSRRLYQTLGLTPPRTYGMELQYRFF
jgi:iron complex outermembrane receptor protein